MGETPQKKMERLTSEADMRQNIFIGNNSETIGVLYNKSRVHCIPGITVSYSSPKRPLRIPALHPPAKKRLAYAFTCDSFPKRLIALLNALIIPSYMMLRSL
jgi:hypothetical protein